MKSVVFGVFLVLMVVCLGLGYNLFTVGKNLGGFCFCMAGWGAGTGLLVVWIANGEN